MDQLLFHNIKLNLCYARKVYLTKVFIVFLCLMEYSGKKLELQKMHEEPHLVSHLHY